MAGELAAEAGPSPVAANIDAVVRAEEVALERRSWADRLSDSIANFAGTITFVGLHIVWLVLWGAINAGLIPFIPAFDPYPFGLLAMIVSIEGVLLSTFVLIKQNRMGYLSDRRAHLDLQVNLLAEREVTRLLRLTEAIAHRLGIEDVGDSGTLAEETAVEQLVEELDRKLSDSG
jgi:uncharacterized membrane protein